MHVQRQVTAVCAPCGWVTRRDPKKAEILDVLVEQHQATPGCHDVKVERIAVIRCHDCRYRSGWLRTVDEVNMFARLHLSSVGHQQIAATKYAERRRRRAERTAFAHQVAVVLLVIVTFATIAGLLGDGPA